MSALRRRAVVTRPAGGAARVSDLRRNGGIWQGICAQVVGPAADGDEGMIIPLLAPGQI